MKDENMLTEIVFSVTSPKDWENEVKREQKGKIKGDKFKIWRKLPLYWCYDKFFTGRKKILK